MKKVLTIVFVVAALIASLMVTVNAAEPVTDVDTLKTALANGGDVVIGADITADETLVVSAATVLDLGGHTLTLNAGEGMYTIANLTVRNGNINATGDDAVVLRANGITVTVEGNVSITANDCCLLIPNNNNLPIEGQLSYNNCVINTAGNLYSNLREKEYAVVSINGNAAGCTVNVTGGSIVGEGTSAIYFPGTTNLNISGGTITGEEVAVYVKSGNLNITGGTFTATGAKTDYSYKKSGTAVAGDAVIIDSCNYPGGNPTVSITGGTFTSTHGAGIGSYAGNGATRLTGFVSGGKVSSMEADLLVANRKLDVNGNVVCAHNNATFNEYVAPTNSNYGYNEHWKCPDCGNSYSDKEGTTLLMEKDILINPLVKVDEEKVEVSEGAMDNAIEEAADSSTVVVPTLEVNDSVTSVLLPASSLATVAAADKKLSIETSEVKLTLDSKAVGKIADQAAEAGEITIEVKKVEENVLNKEQKEAVKDKDVAVVISAKVIADGKIISDFGGGKVKVEIPFTPAENTKGTDYKVVYLADDGKVTVIPSKYVDGKIVVELEHFSEYAIVKDKKVENTVENKVENTVENKVENTTNESGVGSVPGGSDTSTSAPAPAPAPEKDNTPKTGAVSILSVVVVLAIVGYVAFRREER